MVTRAVCGGSLVSDLLTLEVTMRGRVRDRVRARVQVRARARARARARVLVRARVRVRVRVRQRGDRPLAPGARRRGCEGVGHRVQPCGPSRGNQHAGPLLAQTRRRLGATLPLPLLPLLPLLRLLRLRLRLLRRNGGGVALCWRPRAVWAGQQLVELVQPTCEALRLAYAGSR